MRVSLDLIGLVFFLCLLLGSCKLADIYGDMPSTKDDQKIEDLIAKVEEAYGGWENWNALTSVRVNGSDEWPTWHWRLLVNPWKERKVDFQLDWQPLQDNVRIELLSGKQSGDIYGVQQWVTYEMVDGSPVFKKNRAIEFHLPTQVYFYEFPFRIREASTYAYGGTTKIEGKNYDRMMMSWNTLDPQRELDQYLLFINQETSRVEYLQFTVRDQGKFPTATAHYTDFRKVGDFTLPHKVTLFFQNEPPGKSIGHILTVESYDFNLNVPENYFLPDASLSEAK